MTPIIRSPAAWQAREEEHLRQFREAIRVKAAYELQVQGVYPSPRGRFVTRNTETGEEQKVEFYQFFLADPMDPRGWPNLPEAEMRDLLLDRLSDPDPRIRGAALAVAERLYPDMDTSSRYERFLAREAARTGRSIDELKAEAEAV